MAALAVAIVGRRCCCMSRNKNDDSSCRRYRCRQYRGCPHTLLADFQSAITRKRRKLPTPNGMFPDSYRRDLSNATLYRTGTCLLMRSNRALKVGQGGVRTPRYLRCFALGRMGEGASQREATATTNVLRFSRMPPSFCDLSLVTPSQPPTSPSPSPHLPACPFRELPLL